MLKVGALLLSFCGGTPIRLASASPALAMSARANVVAIRQRVTVATLACRVDSDVPAIAVELRAHMLATPLAAAFTAPLREPVLHLDHDRVLGRPLMAIAAMSSTSPFASVVLGLGDWLEVRGIEAGAPRTLGARVVKVKAGRDRTDEQFVRQSMSLPLLPAEVHGAVSVAQRALPNPAFVWPIRLQLSEPFPKVHSSFPHREQSTIPATEL